jgi:tyrosyl-tRNA synthetase
LKHNDSAIPITDISRERLAAGIPVVDILVECGAASSKSQARTLIKQGGITLILGPTELKVTGVDQILTEDMLPKFIDLTINSENKRIYVDCSSI